MNTGDTAPSPSFHSPEQALAYLKHLGSVEDETFDLTEGALAAALVFLPGIHIDRYRNHIQKLCQPLEPEDTLDNRIARLNRLLYEEHGYSGDEEHSHSIENINLIRVIDRRQGIHITLGILYLAAAQHQGWSCEGLSFPGKLLLRMEHKGERAILDPFHHGARMEAADLRKLLKTILGNAAELSHEFYRPLSSREILLRLQNLLKKRYIDNEDYASALIAAETIEAFCPKEYHIHLDKGVLYAKLKNAEKAIVELELYKEKTPRTEEKFQADILIQQIKASLK